MIASAARRRSTGAHTRAWMWLALLAAIALAPATPARAQSEPVVAVLPLSSASERLSIYGAPVAAAVAKHLGAQQRFRIEAPSMTDVLPQRVDLVVDGRIVVSDSGGVQLEARVRDPERGRTVAVVATGARPLAEIDRLAMELAGALGPRLDAAVSAERRRSAAEAGEQRAPDPEDAPSARPPTESRPEPETAAGAPDRSRTDARPAMVIFGAIGQAAGGAVPVEDAATRASEALARRLGHRPVAGAGHGLESDEAAAAALRASGAGYGLVLEVRDVRFAWSGVLTARGEVRAALVDPEGRRIYDQTRHTDTLVGSRGDRHAAVVRLVMEQVVDIFAPELTRLLRDRTARARGNGAP